ncbi:hypothetical protein GYMLUDRAFT_74163 [Collybiopsis luxurians FD-317 M1]|uniref:GDS1 winged helix domain-containing protein n=1 Tax=Collybiopsis luxurians FD-317 M1 TaxID=944289 RepID=A0A0D0CM92_9AGAR|nr:hypothetical protein GYMLUDRAFT_74163 [Collybiopsis luxurians FD-317 M1]
MESQHTITRTRTVKPSIRLKPLPDSSDSHTHPSQLPHFPPPHVVLHPEDAASKIFLAVGRSLMSVDNKAMTIKDLSEMAMTMGYSCQNVSAASQAITTFIRSHLLRCESQLDSPLLLKHVLSGTPADDDLLPALHSTCGGAASTSSEPRLTNFRRGTVVWYLSRATGAPCPFARAGVRLCDYVDMAAPQSAYKKKKESAQCGQKRKRRSTRECVLRHSMPELPLDPGRSSSPLSSIPDSDDDNDDSDGSSEDDEPPPTKIKLTLKLPPLSRVRQATALAQDAPATYRRSPSVPYSVISAASPPPNSEDEEQDYSDEEDEDAEDSDWYGSPVERDNEPPMDIDDLDGPVDQDALHEGYDDDDTQFSDEWDDDNDEELSTTWESPGPRSPSAQPPPAFRVKEEPRDVQGLLDQWECDLDVKDALVKFEDPSNSAWDWDWESGYHSYNGPSSSPSTSRSSPIQPRIKQEDDFDLSFSGPAFTDWRHSVTLSPTTPFGLSFGDEPDVFPMSPSVVPVSPTSPSTDYNTVQRTWTALSRHSPPSDPTISHGLSSLVHSLSMNSPTGVHSPHPLFGSQSVDSSESGEDESVSELRTTSSPCVSPNDIRIEHDNELLNGPGSVVVNTCQPCVPQIVATHVEGIAVYRSSLGPHTLLRRIDTDFVNLTPIMRYAQTTQPSAILGATLVNKGKQEVRGLWAPVEAVRLYVKENIKSSTTPCDSVAILDVFLSDALVERFPTALREFVRTTRESLAKGTLTRQFGKNFGCDDILTPPSSMTGPPNPTLMAAAAAKDRTTVDEQPLSSSFALSVSLVPPVDVPLSATEEEIFDEFCVNLEWEKDVPSEEMGLKEALQTALPLLRTPNHSRPRAQPGTSSPTSSPLSSCPPSPVLHKAQASTRTASSTSHAKSHANTAVAKTSGPLRRSKRVADALAAKSNVRTRSSNRGSRNVS